MNELKNNISSILPGLSMAFPIIIYSVFAKTLQHTKKEKDGRLAQRKSL
jgi:hypothetical protein